VADVTVVVGRNTLTVGPADTMPTVAQILGYICNMLYRWDKVGVPDRGIDKPSPTVMSEGDIGSAATNFPCVSFVTGSYPGYRVPLYNSCDECREAVIKWNTGKISSYSVTPRSTRWITVEGTSSQQIDDKPCARELSTVAVPANGDPPEDMRELVVVILRAFSDQDCVRRSQIPELVLRHLDEFASRVSGKDHCEVNAIFGCGSCCNDDRRANYVDTTCGWQCWTCAADPCG
jgi:hypothetical protein